VFENSILRRIFGSKKNEVTESWRKLHDEELHNLYSSQNIVKVVRLRRMTWVGYVVPMGETRSAFRILVGKPEGKRPLRRPMHKWEGNIKMDLREIMWMCVD
jgi:hypothetical protein